ncbi:MAG: hypothetical protein J0I48_11340 [Devosia sp.]|uniref:hypothetical protein n=1 Tax=Devosia sp. 66-22 TaxID=1895753 RepID=UPI001ACAAEEE|nr:hypothetical protein [Devosia sp. 66-22]MBN9346776.1 hypothetical protein [Devosia sp.]MCW5705516.1 hypothetical protein [Bradyrhizobium sp.]
MSETQSTKDELRKLSVVTVPRLLVATALAAVGFLVGAFVVVIDPIQTTQRIGLLIFFPSAIFVMTTVASTIGYLLFQHTDAMTTIQSIRKSDHTRISQMPVMRRFVLREVIR